jgi:hypothetical protein
MDYVGKLIWIRRLVVHVHVRLHLHSIVPGYLSSINPDILPPSDSFPANQGRRVLYNALRCVERMLVGLNWSPDFQFLADAPACDVRQGMLCCSRHFHTSTHDLHEEHRVQTESAGHWWSTMRSRHFHCRNYHIIAPLPFLIISRFSLLLIGHSHFASPLINKTSPHQCVTSTQHD